MRTELLVDVVQMVAQGLRSDSEVACNLCRIFPRRKRSQDILFMLRKGRDRRRPQYHVWQAGQLARNIHHLVEKFFVFLSDGNIASKVDNQTVTVSGIFKQ